MKIKKFIREGAGKYIALAVTLLVVVGLVALNLLLSYFGSQRLLYIDLTPEEFYTVSDAMKEQMQFVEKLEDKEKKIKITFCTDPDILTANQNLRMPYFLALGLAKLHPEKIEVETVNVTYNPTAVSKYKANSMTRINPTDIIISYGDRYRIVGADNMWVSDSTGELYSFNGEYRMATIMLSVTAKERPVAYFVTGHGETYYDTQNPTRVENADAQAIYDLLTERGLEVKTFDITEGKLVPEDCVLLVINNPREDYHSDGDRMSLDYISETEILDRYLVRDQGAIMVAKDPTIKLHNFDLFLYEWGFDIADAIVSDEEYYLDQSGGGTDKIIGAYDTDTDSYGMAIYEEYASLPSAPPMVFSKTGFINCAFGAGYTTNEPGTVTVNRNYAPFFYTSGYAVAYTDSDGAGKYGGDGVYNVGYHDASTHGRMDIAGVTTRMAIDQYTAEYEYSYIFCSPSADAFSNAILGNGSYANYEIMSALVENISRIDAYASIELGGTSFNSPNLGGKPILDVSISSEPIYETTDEGLYEIVLSGLTSGKATTYFVVILTVPAIIATVGIVVRVKRKYR